MRSGIKTWCDLHKRNADSLIKPSCGCRLCKELPKNHPINFSTILQECGAEGEGGEAKRWLWGCGGRGTSFLHTLCAEVPLFQHRSLGRKGSRGGGGWETRGPAGVEEKNRLNVLTAAPFFFPYFAHGSDFLLKGWAFQGAPGSAQQALFTLEKQSSFPVYKSACFWGEGRGGEKKMEYFRVHMEAKLVRENAVHLNFK